MEIFIHMAQDSLKYSKIRELNTDKNEITDKEPTCYNPFMEKKILRSKKEVNDAYLGGVLQ